MKNCPLQRSERGFTLIELLAVILIIGLLATLAAVSLANSRAKARDAKRFSDVKQLALGLETVEASNPSSSLTGCTAAGTPTTSTAPTCVNIGEIKWANFVDPSAKVTTACSSTTPTNTCQYTMGKAGSTSGDYEICFVTEKTTNLGPAGIYRISTGGTMSAGCAF